jgi:CheY-like chemotaxis protein
MHRSHRILVAAQPGASRLLQAMLGDLADLVVVHTTADAFKVLQHERMDLIVCTIAFDESRMMDFLQAAKKGSSTAGTPFLCSRILPGVLRDNLVATMRDACKECGAVDLIDIATLPPDRAQAALRQAVAGCLAAPTASEDS